MNNEIQLEDLKLSIIALWRNKLLIISATVLAALIGLLITFDKESVNIYVADTTVYSSAIGSKEADVVSSALISYADIITSNKVCERAASLLSGEAELEAADIQRMLGVTAVNDAVINISAYSSDPDLAIKVTNATAEAFVREVTGTTGNDEIQILDAAKGCYIKVDGKKELFLYRMIFAAIGFFLSCAYIMIMELTSNKLRTVMQCVEEDENEILGIIPYME